MMVLKREAGDTIHIVGEDVVLTVIECENGQVTLGFEAPGGIKILNRNAWTLDGEREGAQKPQGPHRPFAANRVRGNDSG